MAFCSVPFTSKVLQDFILLRKRRKDKILFSIQFESSEIRKVSFCHELTTHLDGKTLKYLWTFVRMLNSYLLTLLSLKRVKYTNIVTNKDISYDAMQFIQWTTKHTFRVVLMMLCWSSHNSLSPCGWKTLTWRDWWLLMYCCCDVRKKKREMQSGYHLRQTH